MPDTAEAGTGHEADTPQLPQSTRPLELVRHCGWFCGRLADGLIVATLRAPSPP
jgi:hypothetical protein